MRSSLWWLTPLFLISCSGGTDGETKPGCETWYADGDADGYGDPAAPVEACSSADQAGLVDNADDCDDANAMVHPGAAELCDPAGVDEDCDGLINDDDDAITGGIELWLDTDGDGFGDPATQQQRCALGDGVRNADDCDDSDPATFPGAAELDDPSACMTDADGDGWGANTPSAGAAAGSDCDDDEASAHPGATEWLGDDVDQDCDGEAEWFLFDDFELSVPDPALWLVRSGDQGMTQDYAHSGSWAMALGGDGAVSSRPFDTTLCENMSWSYRGKRGPDDPEPTDTLSLQIHDGSGWIDVDVWTGGSDPDFVLRSGLITLPSAYHPDLELRLVADGEIGSDDFLVDDFRLSCPGPDGDGDGIGANDDCDDTNADHWSDCGLCVDTDGDGYGSDCDRGDDCDDGNPAIHPGQPDTSADGIDDDCDGFDGPSLVDDFELGAPDPAVWDSIIGDAEHTTLYAASGSYSLKLGGGGGTAVSVPLDTSGCDQVSYTMRIKRGPEAPDDDDSLVLEWFDGTTWIEALAVIGETRSDPDFLDYQGTLDDPAALHSGLQIQLISEGSAEGNDLFFVDDLAVFCGGDGDGDGFFGSLDCDDNDPRHWDDCGTCVDVDNDDFGLGCDLGDDCDDNDALIYPGVTDPPGDGIDTDCNGIDGPGIIDDFELGAPDRLVWRLVSGDHTYDTTYAVSGATSLNLGGGGGLAESVQTDMSVCADGVTLRYQVKRGPEVPETGDDLILEWHDGTSWAELDRVLGGGGTDPDFIERETRLVDPRFRADRFRIRLISVGSSAGNDDFFVDDLLVGCARPDGDGDGIDVDRDCDDADAAHWSDCGICVDADGDDRGAGCDLGDDCDDDDDTVFVGQLDPAGDGLDADCGGFDGPGVFDDFELGSVDPFVWDEMRHGFTYTTDEAYSGAYGLRMSLDAVAETVRMDTRPCGMVQWTYRGKRGPQAPEFGDDLVLEWFDGTTWIEADRWEGQGLSDLSFTERTGLIRDPAALRSGLQIRLEAHVSSNTTDEFHVDDLRITCAAPDADGDGFPIDFDCDDGDPLHWSDCGVCTDGDGDGFGVGCDLGPDCDDASSTTFPGAPDPLGDGLDTDCDRLDQPGLLDDFELGMIDPFTWRIVEGGHGHDTTFVHAGTYALRLDGAARIVSEPFDVSSCAELLWSYQGKRGPGAPEEHDDLVLSWFDGTDWIEADALLGRGVSDVTFFHRWGTITDPAALSAGLQIQLENTGLNNSDVFFVDDLTVICGGGGDSDGDGVPIELDCDDGDPLHWSDCGACADADGDGFGLDCDLGPDCDDNDNTVSPVAPDPAGDGLDSDCNSIDGPGLFDDFELGYERPETWSSFTTGGQVFYGVVEDAAAGGRYALNLDASVTAETQDLDTSGCTSVLWSYRGKRGPGPPEVDDDLVLEWFDGTDWIEADTFAGAASIDSVFSHRFGVITDPAALHGGFRVRLATTSTSSEDDFYVDDFVVGCTGPDADGDGFPTALDCDEGDVSHWSDCSTCVDADGDDFGPGCDLGDDCDDGDASLNPATADSYGDGIDSDCDGFDGDAITDDFELGVPDPATWDTYTGTWTVVSDPVASGSYSLNLDDTNTFDSHPIDTSTCPLITWSYQVKRGPDEPGNLVDLELYYDDGTDWVRFDVVEGGETDPGFVQRTGVLLDPAALHGGFRVRLATTSTVLNDDFYVDDLAVACAAADGDGDGFPPELDCDDSDPLHWSDCGLCADADGDGFGTDCDLGDDCDDADSGVSPAALDLYGDGLDTNCDGFDGVAIADDFELGIPDPAVWSEVSGEVAEVVSSQAASGSYSLNLDGSTLAETVVIDATVCPEVLWRYQARRGPSTPEAGDDLVLSFFDGLTWVTADVLTGGIADSDFAQRFGVLPGAAIWPGLRVRLETTSLHTSDDFYIDDFAIACTEPDTDGDGVPGALDCDDGDPDHWLDCDTCVDVDGDDFGPGCDLGPDCDDADGATFPGASDPVGDGQDTSCSGIDGPGLFDDFELGVRAPGVWSTLSGDYRYDASQAASGSYSLNLSGGGATAVSVPIDASTCGSIIWSYEAKRGPEVPDEGDDLVLSWSNGTSWIVMDVLEGNRVIDASFQTRQGSLVDPGALFDGLQIRLQSNGSSSGSDDFYVDDLFLDCGLGDADGDGIDGTFDCDDGDAAHWSDCGTCVDVDGDGFGTGCDLGPDCDDGDALLFPGAADPVGDGLDTDCSGIDGVGIVDDFELGAPAPWWASVGGDYSYDATQAASGSYSLNLGGGGASAESVPMDTSGCSRIDWSYAIQRGPLPPGSNAHVRVEYHDGASWVPVDFLVGTGVTEPGFGTRAGSITSAGALWGGFRIRWVSAGGSAGSDDFYIDDLAVSCTP